MLDLKHLYLLVLKCMVWGIGLFYGVLDYFISKKCLLVAECDICTNFQSIYMFPCHIIL